MRFKLYLAGFLLLMAASPLMAADWPQFRGPNRTGISPEKGLLQTWPKDGPKLLWTYRDAGMGFSGPSVVGERLFTMGGSEDAEFVLAVDLKTQKELWKAKVGKLFSHGQWGDGPRSTPTVDGGLVYALGSYGDLVCVHAEDGKEVWRKSLVADLGGKMMSEWGYSESPLVDGDMLIVTPGSAVKGTLAALDKKTGKLIWQGEGLKHAAPYSSVMISNAAGVKQYIQTSYLIDEEEGFVSGFDPKTGNPLWTEKVFSHHSYAIAPTPIVRDDLVYVTSGYGGGSQLFKISKASDGLQAKGLYARKSQQSMINTHGGVVLVGDHVYGHSERNKWVCQDFKTGKAKWTERTEFVTGAICAADGRLYLYSDEGAVTLLVPNPKEWEPAGNFTIPETSKLREGLNFRQAAVWTHPITAHGKLYLRDQELIFCYDVKK